VKITPGPNVNGIWIQPRPDLVFGDIKHAQEVNNVRNIRIPGYWYDKDGVTPDNSARPVPGQKIAYYIHGGAFVSGSAHPSEAYSTIPNGLLHHCPSINRVFSLEYRLLRNIPAVEGAFPAMILDSLNGYMHLIELGYAPEDIILVGDSAGGNLTLSLCRYLIEYADEKSLSGVSLPRVPGALLLISPWGDVGNSHNETRSRIENKRYDYVIAGPMNQEYTSWAIGRQMDANIANTNPWISPISKHVNGVSFRGFPKTFIAAGDLEVLRDQIVVLKETMEREIGEDNVEYYLAPLAVHDFIMLGWHEPERTDGLKKVAAWVATL
jgi:acetyl esterase/lipase